MTHLYDDQIIEGEALGWEWRWWVQFFIKLT